MSGPRLLFVVVASVVVFSSLSAGVVLTGGGAFGGPLSATADTDAALSGGTDAGGPVRNVTILETNAPVLQGDYLQVDFRVNGSVANETAHVFIGNESVGELEYESGYEEAVESRIPARTEDISPGTYDLTVRVGNASDSVPVTILERSPQSRFDVDITRIDQSVAAGELLVVDYEVENLGLENGTQDVALAVNGRVVDTDTLSLSPEELREGKLVYRTKAGEVGDLAVSVRTANTSATRDVTVTESEPASPPYFDFFVSGTFPLDRAAVGERVTTNGYVTNEGGRAGVETLRLRVNSRTVDTDTVVLRPNETAVFDLSYTPRRSDLGIVEPTIVGSNTTVTQSFGVVDPSRTGFVRVSVPERVGPVPAGESLRVPVEVVNIGGDTAYQNVSLVVDNRTVDTERPLLESGQGGALPSPLTYRTNPNETGELNVTVRSENDSVSRTVTVTEPDETQNESEGVVYWQVDFGAGADPPRPPSYWPDDLLAALGNSADGVTESPSLYRARNESQLGAVDVVGNDFSYDDEGNPTEVTVRFAVAENATQRDLHLAVYTLPGPFEMDEVDRQRLYASVNGSYDPGETGELTLPIPQPEDVPENRTVTPMSAAGFAPLDADGPHAPALTVRHVSPGPGCC